MPVVVAIPEADAAVMPGAEPADKQHVTLSYFESDGPLGDTVATAVGAAFRDVPPTTIVVGGVGLLGEEGAFVAFADSAGVRGLRGAALYGLEQAGIDGTGTHPGFTPHVTLGYPPNLADVDLAAIAEAWMGREIRIERVELWDSDVVLGSWRLTGPRTAGAGVQASDLFGAPLHPPVEWFALPAPDEVSTVGLTITAEGQVFGLWYQTGVCLLDGTDECWMPSPSPTGYALAHQADVEVALPDGTLELREQWVCPIGLVGGHAPDGMSIGESLEWYGDPQRIRIVARLSDHPAGGWLAGALTHDATHGDVATLRRGSLSGHWEPIDFRAVPGLENLGVAYDCLGPTPVSKPGLPIMRPPSRKEEILMAKTRTIAGVEVDVDLLRRAASAATIHGTDLTPVVEQAGSACTCDHKAASAPDLTTRIAALERAERVRANAELDDELAALGR